MISARDYTVPPSFGEPTAEKDRIVAIMRSYEKQPYGIAEGYLQDLKSGDFTKTVDCSFRVENVFWYEEDLYNLEKNDLVLNDAFIQAILELGPAE